MLVEQLRRHRWTGLRIVQQTRLSRATVSRILRRLKPSRMRDLKPKPAVRRYEHARPGDLLHLGIKKLCRVAPPSHRATGDRRDSVSGIGWEYLQVAIDDHSRIAFSALYPDEKQASVLAFLAAALAYYARFGIRFPNADGGAMDTGNYRNRILKPLAEKLEIPKLNFQILRRTMATQAQRMGSVKDIQAHLRHSRADTTANEYMQELPESVKQMVGSVHAMLTKRASSETESANLLPNATNREESSPASC